MGSQLAQSWSGHAQSQWKVAVVGTEAPAPDARTRQGHLTDEEATPRRQVDDEALVKACLSGDKSAFDILVERHRRRVYLVCYRFASQHEEASDLAQDVFIRAYRGLRHFRGRSSLATWLYRIAINVCLNRFARRTPALEPLEAERLIDRDSDGPADAILRAERAARVRAAIARLPKKQRATLVLRVYQDLSHEQIARILGSSVGAAKANLCHALANLRKLLLAQGGDPWLSGEREHETPVSR